MNKPISMLIKETKENLVNVCNTSQLPPNILVLIFENIHTEISILAKKQLEQDELIYMTSLEENKEIETNNNY